MAAAADAAARELTVPDTVTLDRLAGRIIAIRPAETELDREFAFTVYRLLARGAPVDRAAIAECMDASKSLIARTIETWPTLIELDRQGAVTGFGGLTLDPTRHRLEVAGQVLHTWCAWDAIFIPGILHSAGRLESKSPAGGETVVVSVDETGTPTEYDPAVTMTMPDTACCDLETDVRGTFCDAVNLFPSLDSAREWAQGRKGLFALTLEQAAAMGCHKNITQFGDLVYWLRAP